MKLKNQFFWGGGYSVKINHVDVDSFIQTKGPRWDLVCLVWTWTLFENLFSKNRFVSFQSYFLKGVAWSSGSVMLVQSARTGPPAPARYARTGWDTCPASLAPLASLTLKVLLNATRIYQSLLYQSLWQNKAKYQTRPKRGPLVCMNESTSTWFILTE